MQIEFQGQARQDEFVANILNFKEDGYYLDIGSCDAISTSNTYYLESLGWNGICVEIDPQHVKSYDARTCYFVNGDATQLDYKDLLDRRNYPPHIDYLSLDVDELSTAVLQKLPLDDYRFNIITIEHDFYRLGGEFRDIQRGLLHKHGYSLLFADVLVPLNDEFPPDCAFEDWWIDPTTFDMEIMKKLSAEKLYPKQIIDVLKESKS